MTKMSWSRSFSLALVVLLLFAGLAGAVTVTEEASPAEAEIGTEASSTYVIEELYQNPTLEEWTLEGETELANATWTVQLVDQAGNVVDTASDDGSTVSKEVSIEDDASQIRIRLVGTVPERSNWTYEPWQSFLFAELRQSRAGGTTNVIDSWTTAYYSNESLSARTAIDEAAVVVEESGNAEARETLNSSISAYEAGNFENAESLAQRAEQESTQAQQRSQQIRLVLYAVVALVVLAIIVGAVYWYRSKQTTSRL